MARRTVRRRAASASQPDELDSEPVMDGMQRTIGNRAIADLLGVAGSTPSAQSAGAVHRVAAVSGRVIQRNWGTDSLGAINVSTGWTARFHLINGWSIAYMLETFDELKKQRKLDEYVTAAHSPANVASIYGDRIIAALKTVAGTYDAEFYTCMASVQGNDPQGYAEMLRRGGKGVSETRILASVPQLAIRLLSAGDVPGAGGVLDRLSMTALIDTMQLVVAAGHLAKVNSPAVHPVAARAWRIMIAAAVASWSTQPTKWAEYEKILGPQLANLSPADKGEVISWVTNKPELAHISELGQTVADAGQFAFGSMLAGKIAETIDAAGAGGDATIKAAFKASTTANDPGFWKLAAAAAKVIRKSFPALGGLLAVGDPSKKRGLTIYEELWAEYQKSKTTAGLAKHLSLYEMQALAIAELDRCNAQVRHMHALHTNVGPKAAHGPSPALSHGGLASGVKDYRVPKTKEPWRASQVRYIGDLGSAVGSMRAVLDAEDRIIMGVLSGATGGMTPEHYLYVIGYRGNAFICSDSDPNNEKPGVLPTKGITYLYYDPAANRLSSAPSDEAFPIDWDPTVGEGRFQMSGAHRYQALTIAKLPAKR